jgi:serine/threonine-protein kinase
MYSLGVVLYELLTGVKPRKLLRDAGGGVAAAMHEPSPTLPSVAAVNEPFRAKLRGDLDTIVLKALKRAPAERYATVHAFADDLRRHAQGLPILARPDSAWYRVSKFARRHAVPMAAAAAVLVAVLAGAGVAVWQARVARAEQQRAEEVKEFIASIFEGASPYAAAGQKLSAVDLLQQARARIDHIDDARPELRTELLTLVGSSLAELMEMKDALTILRETVDEATRTLGPDHELTLRARTALSLPQRFLGDPEQVAPELDDLLQRLRASPGPAEDLVEALESHADVAMKRARWDAAEASSREMLAVARSRLGERHPLALSARWSLVQSLLLAGKNKEAAAQADEAYPLMVEAYRSEPKAPVLIEASELYGRVLTGVGRLGEGISYIARAMDDAAALFGRDSVHIGYYGANLAARQLQAGEFDAALASVDRGLAVSAVVPGPDSGLHAFSHHVRGRILLAARKGSAAVEQLDLAIEKLRSAGTRSAQRLAAARSERALALAYTGAIDEALADLHPRRSAPPHRRDRRAAVGGVGARPGFAAQGARGRAVHGRGERDPIERSDRNGTEPARARRPRRRRGLARGGARPLAPAPAPDGARSCRYSRRPRSRGADARTSARGAAAARGGRRLLAAVRRTEPLGWRYEPASESRLWRPRTARRGSRRPVARDADPRARDDGADLKYHPRVEPGPRRDGDVDACGRSWKTWSR